MVLAKHCRDHFTVSLCIDFMGHMEIGDWYLTSPWTRRAAALILPAANFWLRAHRARASGGSKPRAGTPASKEKT
jgi:hypothetical protein